MDIVHTDAPLGMQDEPGSIPGAFHVHEGHEIAAEPEGGRCQEHRPADLPAPESASRLRPSRWGTYRLGGRRRIVHYF